MSDSLTRTRQEIDTLLASLRSDLDAAAAARVADLNRREAELNRREAELARSAELITADIAVRSAWQQCQAVERQRMQRLIGMQLEHLAPTSSTRTVLHTLSRLVEASE